MADPPINPTGVNDSTKPTGALTSSAKVGDSSHSSLLTINAAPHLPHKLTSNNYPLWRAQLLSFLSGCGLEGFVDGSHPCISRDRQDQLILSWIFPSVSEGVMPIIVSSSTSKAAWDSLARVFAPSSRLCILHLKEQLYNLKRGNDSITTYMQSVKGIVDDLAIIGQPLAEEDLILAVLKGLGGAYRDFRTSICLHAGNLSFADLHGLLLTQELHIVDADTVVPEILPPTANNATRSSHYNQSCSNSGNRGNNSSCNYRNNNNSGNYRNNNSNNYRNNNNSGNYHNNNRGSHDHCTNSGYSRNNNRGSHDNRLPPLLTCELCNQSGHSAKVCPQRFNHAFLGEHPSYLVANPNTSTWTVDSGCTNHLTTDMNNMLLHSEYTGPDQILLGDGSGLKISGVGSSTLNSPCRSFALSDILHVPNISRNLPSVHQFYLDNDVFFEFHSSFFVLPNNTTTLSSLVGERTSIDESTFPFASSVIERPKVNQSPTSSTLGPLRIIQQPTCPPKPNLTPPTPHISHTHASHQPLQLANKEPNATPSPPTSLPSPLAVFSPSPEPAFIPQDDAIAPASLSSPSHLISGMNLIVDLANPVAQKPLALVVHRHPMVTRSRDGTIKNKALNTTVQSLPSYNEPTS
ncbi:hypothetical protein Vadar_028936 [Vaccinium darrowii]|uniref:Uncharacterized protein n=1 Tax=Vaccinium darrowii TaxID=229202 RepID=A0ACB7YQ90_9ERIC|nr:hypothetical protein Vadar_028936 [Vaccinium darrowii]